MYNEIELYHSLNFSVWCLKNEFYANIIILYNNTQ